MSGGGVSPLSDACLSPSSCSASFLTPVDIGHGWTAYEQEAAVVQLLYAEALRILESHVGHAHPMCAHVLTLKASACYEDGDVLAAQGLLLEAKQTEYFTLHAHMDSLQVSGEGVLAALFLWLQLLGSVLRTALVVVFFPALAPNPLCLSLFCLLTASNGLSSPSAPAFLALPLLASCR